MVDVALSTERNRAGGRRVAGLDRQVLSAPSQPAASQSEWPGRGYIVAAI